MSTASTILVVEDDAIVRMLIVDVLEELEYMVLEAADATQALKNIENTDQAIDLMMTDWGLPGMNGNELAKKPGNYAPHYPSCLPAVMPRTLSFPKVRR